MVVLAELCGMVLSEKTTLPDSILEINFCDMPNTVSYRHFRTSPEIIQHAVMLYLAGLKFTPKKILFRYRMQIPAFRQSYLEMD